MMNNNLKYAFLEFLTQHRLIDKGQRVLVAVSGGIDSVVLLHLMAAWQSYFHMELGVAHLNHQLRGKASQADEVFVKALADQYSLPFYSAKMDIRAFAGAEKLSLEEAGHHLRKKFLKEIARKEGFQLIATAHHLNDQAETVLMRLLRGTGLEGLAGIRLKNGPFVRPLLFCSKDDIRAYAAANHLKYREDLSNQDLRFERNRVRHRLLPFIEKEFDYFDPVHLYRLSMIAQDWEKFLQSESEKLYNSAVLVESENKIRLDIPIYQKYFSGIQIKVIKRVFENLNQPLQSLTYQQFQGFQRWLSQEKKDGKFRFSGGLLATRGSAAVQFSVEEEVGDPEEINIWLNDGDTFQDGQRNLWLRLHIADWEAGRAIAAVPGIEYLDATMLTLPLRLRSWKPGDRFRPLGMSQSKKIKDFLTDERELFMPKNQAIVLENRGEIVYVVGSRISDRYKVTNETQRILKIEYGVL